MKELQDKADTLAVGISILCTIHCLAMPFLVVALPVLGGLYLAEEGFHLWMVYGILPISIYALLVGNRKHENIQPVVLGFVGLSILVFAALAGHDVLGEAGERAITVLGSIAVAAAHLWNQRLCRQLTLK